MGNSINPSKRKSIGLLGGTFDPIHFGHLNLAFELMEKRELDEVWFIPTQLNPFKIECPPTSIEHRLAMVQLAIQDIPEFRVKDFEKDREPPSYTIHTLRQVVQEEASNLFPHQFYLLMGEDAVVGFLDWHLPEEILQLAPLLIGSRSGTWENVLESFQFPMREIIQQGLTTTRLMDISSTQLRERLAQGKYCRHLIPSPVFEYLKSHSLYTNKR